MKTSFEFEHQGHKMKAEYEQTVRLNMGSFKLFSFRVLKGGAWVYQGTMSFPVKATKKQIVENVEHISFGTEEAGDE